MSRRTRKEPFNQNYPTQRITFPTEKSKIGGTEAVRWTLGIKDKNKPTKTILMIGQTGTGKTTLINTMINFKLGQKWEPPTSSRTSTITVSELFLETHSSYLRIIDTPGFGATHDIADHLDSLFQSEDDIQKIEVVGLVVKASLNRLDEFKKNIYNDIFSLFGKDMDENIVLFITHSDGLPAENVITALREAEVPCAKDDSGKPINFMFNNRQHDNDEKEQDSRYWAMWDLGNQSLNDFFNILETLKGTKLTMTKDVLREHKKLKGKQQDAAQIEHQCKWIQKSLQEIEAKQPDIRKAPIESKWWHLNKGATTCTICKENCHYPYCWFVKNPSRCSVMTKKHCTVCTARCHYSHHVKEMFRYVPNIQKMNKKENIGRRLKDTKTRRRELSEDISQCITELQKIALRPTSQDKKGWRPSDGGESSSSNEGDRPHMLERMEVKETGRGNLRLRRGGGPSHEGDRQPLLDETEMDEFESDL